MNELSLPQRAKALPDRITTNVVVIGECWIWTGFCNPRGYGTIHFVGADGGPKTTRLIHRAVYELLVGPIPEGLTLDHLCRVRNCINPAHLEPVSNRTNILRGVGLSAQNARKTHCVRGHPLWGENLIIYDHRRCRICTLENQRVNRRKRKERLH